MALTTAFAKNGNRKAVPQATADGSVSYNEGFGNLYALPPEEGGLFIDRAQFNQIMYDTTSAVITNQNSISTLNTKVTANQNSINTLNQKVADIESGVSTGVVNLTGNQTIGGVKKFSVPPVSAANPTNNNQVANKAYVDNVGNSKVATTTYNADKATFATKTELNTKAGFVTKTLAIGANEQIKNLNEFRLFAVKNFAHFYILSLTSDIEETEALDFNGVNFGFNSSEYTITFKQEVRFSYGCFFLGKIGLKMDSPQQEASIVFSNSVLQINGDLTFTDTYNASAELTTGRLGAISLANTNAYFGDGDTWNITTAKRHFMAILGSRVQVGNVTFNGNIPADKELFHFARQGILMTQNSTFNNFTISGIAQNAVSSKGIWVKD